MLRNQQVSGSSPLTSSTSEWTTLHSKSPAKWLGISHTAPSFLLCAKSPVCCGLSPCKRGRYASVAFPTFWGTPSPAGKTRIFRENDTGRGFPQALLKSRPGRLPHKMGRLPLERVGERMDRPNERLRALSAYSARRRLATDSRKNDDPPTGRHWSISLI